MTEVCCHSVPPHLTVACCNQCITLYSYLFIYLWMGYTDLSLPKNSLVILQKDRVTYVWWMEDFVIYSWNVMRMKILFLKLLRRPTRSLYNMFCSRNLRSIWSNFKSQKPTDPTSQNKYKWKGKNNFRKQIGIFKLIKSLFYWVLKRKLSNVFNARRKRSYLTKYNQQ